MCRLAAYLGPEIPLENIVISPKHSLLQQSQNAAEAKLAVNGDGFGVAWYDQYTRLGLYRDVLPAWSNGNLTSICRMVRSTVFLAHVRASTTGETARANCHPFTYGKWAFAHNGQVADFARIRRALELSLPDDLYAARRGTTDSELLFLLCLANGLDEDPHTALARTIAQIKAMQGDIRRPNRITCVVSDGMALYGLRYACDRRSPTLYVSETLDNGGNALASEPLDGVSQGWRKIENSAFVALSNKGIELQSFKLQQVGGVAHRT